MTNYNYLTVTSKALGLALAISAALGTDANARNTIVGLASTQSPDALKGQIERVIGHLTKTLKPDETALFFDASKVKLIAKFAVPEGSGASNPRVMLNANRQALGELKRFIDSAEAIPGHVGRIDLPNLLRSVRQYYPAQGGADFIVLGSPITDASQTPSLSMRGGRVPNDGHVAAKIGQSSYGTTGLSGSLAGYDFYFGDTGEPWSVSDPHRYHVKRFWSLEVEGHGASLAYFNDDLKTLFQLAGHDAPNQQHGEPLIPTDKLEMLQFAPDTGQVADIYTQPLEIEPAPEPLWRAALNPRIGINWNKAKVDLDLYVRPTPSSPVIFFDQAKTADGQLFKDFRDSPVNGFETAALDGVFDLSAMTIAINFYGGEVPASGVSGELRIAIGDDVWAKTFSISATKGNRGAGVQTVILKGIAANEAWIVIDPTEVVTGK